MTEAGSIGGCGHSTPACAFCVRSRQEFSDFLATGPTDDEKRDWLIEHSKRLKGANAWPRNGC